jgi:hypothetical protein
MKLYLLKQDTNNDYDTYDSCVVCAKDEDAARHIHPDWEFQKGKEWWKEKRAYDWALIDDVQVTYIGEAAEYVGPGVVCASFNAG